MEGSSLGPYRIVSELGSGGMGRVWLAEAAERCAVPAGTRVALKIVHPHLLSEPGFFKRFLREAEIGKAVVHPNVVRCYDCDQLVVDGAYHSFLVMEYVEGQTLRDLLDELETVPEELCRHIGREVSKGLSAIHEAGVVHRDLKPENVLITPDHEVKVMDLGVARLADEAIRLSRSGAFVGSVLYASPEHFKGGGEDLDGRADLFSLGVILYELASGAHPHPGDDFASVLAKVVEEKPRRLGERNPQLSAFFEEVVHALLAKDREERLASGSNLLEVLEQGEKSTWWGRRAKAIRAQTKRPLRRIRIPRETAVYGREEELGKLRALYEQAKISDGQVVLIEGEAGIGKTRLVDELIGRLQQDGEEVNFLYGSYPPGGAATASGAWSTAYREHFGAEGLEETLGDYLTVTPILVPAFAALLRGEPPVEGKEPLTKDSLQTVFVHATRALAAERTTVVMIEDLHFAPEEGRAMFAALALAVPELRILMVGTARPGLPEDWRANLERLDQASRMELSRLGPKHLAALLEDSFQSRRLADDLGMQIARKSDGNPFFVFEIIRGLREGQFITREPDCTWVSTQVIQEIEIPSSVQDLIQARIADLDEEEQELLDVAACCGFEFDPTLVAEALDLRPVPSLRRLGHLEKSHRLVRSVGRDYVFDHHQVQEALYGALNDHLREQYHAGIGEVLLARHPEPDGATAVDLCEHFLKSGRGEKALPHLDAALEHLQKGYLNYQAVALADHALDAEDLLKGARRAEVLMKKAALLHVLGRRTPQESALREAVQLVEASGEKVLASRAHVAMGICHNSQSRYEAGWEEFLHARNLAQEIGDLDAEVHATINLGIVLSSLGRYEDARKKHEDGLRLARKSSNRGWEATARMNLGGVLLHLGSYEEAREHYERGVAIATETGDRAGEAIAVVSLGVLSQYIGRHEEMRERFERSLAISIEVGNRRSESIALGNLGNAFGILGRYEEARESYERGVAISIEIGDRAGEGVDLLNLGSLYTRLGDLDRATELLGESLAVLREIGARREEGYALHGLAETTEAAGDSEVARGICEEAVALRRSIEYKSGLASTLIVLGRILLAEGPRDDARAHFEEALQIGRELESPESTVVASALLAQLPGADPAFALATLRKYGPRLPVRESVESHFFLWRATSDQAHLAEAHRLLCHLRDHAPEEYRETMIANVPLHRDIMAAWAEHGSAT